MGGSLKQDLVNGERPAVRADGVGSTLSASAARTAVPFGAIVLIVTSVVGLSLYSSLASLVKNPADYRFFPPFERWNNRNNNDHLGAEYYNIAGALVAGRGYADPFGEQTGPTAWMAPVLSWLLAGLRWLTGGDKDAVIALFILLQDLTLIGTGILALALGRRVGGWSWAAVVAFVAAMAYNFRLCFQFTHDCWIVLAAVDLLVAGLVWGQPLVSSWWRSVGWGVFGGLCALVSPVVGFSWGLLALGSGWQRGRRGRLAVAIFVSMLTISPWVIRNYIMFTRLIPVKSNLAYELYQSQCLDASGVLQGSAFGSHPYTSGGAERREYARVGEMAYLDKKWQLFKDSVSENPSDFVRRVGNRFLAATVVYMPFGPAEERRHPWRLSFTRWTYPLPFLALVFLAVSSLWRPLNSAHWVVMAVYLSFLLPYVLVSYYDRYKFPLMGTEIALILFAAHRLWQMIEPFRGTDFYSVAEETADVWVDTEEDKGAELERAGETGPLPGSIHFSCTGCGRTLRAGNELALKSLKCPRCGHVAVAPAKNGSLPVPAGLTPARGKPAQNLGEMA